MRSADEGSTILYTVCISGLSLVAFLTLSTCPVCQMQIRMACKQLNDVLGVFYEFSFWERCYTYTPTEQKSATTPKLPSVLATIATTASRVGIVDFGRL